MSERPTAPDLTHDIDGGSPKAAHGPRLTLPLAGLLVHALACDAACERCVRAHETVADGVSSNRRWADLFEHVRDYDAGRERIVAAARAFADTVPRVRRNEAGARAAQVLALRDLELALDGQPPAKVQEVLDDGLRALVRETLEALNMARRTKTPDAIATFEAWLQRLGEQVGTAVEQAREEGRAEAPGAAALELKHLHTKVHGLEESLRMAHEELRRTTAAHGDVVLALMSKVEDLEEELRAAHAPDGRDGPEIDWGAVGEKLREPCPAPPRTDEDDEDPPGKPTRDELLEDLAEAYRESRSQRATIEAQAQQIADLQAQLAGAVVQEAA